MHSCRPRPRNRRHTQFGGRGDGPLALLLCTGSIFAWRMMHGHDPRLMGTWLVTHDARPTGQELAAATAKNRFVAKSEWTLHGAGRGRADFQALLPVPRHQWDNFRWWTQGDRLFIQWNKDATGWESVKETVADVDAGLRGRPQKYPVHEYTFMVEDYETIRVEVVKSPWTPQHDVIYLTRIEGE